MFIRIEPSPAISTTRACGLRHLHADGGRQAIAHCAEAAAGHPVVRFIEMEMLGRPHLMLTDFRRNVGITPLGRRIKPLDRILRLDDLVGIFIGKRFAPPPFIDLSPPIGERFSIGLAAARLPTGKHRRNDMSAIADDAEIDLDVLVDRRRIDVDMDFL